MGGVKFIPYNEKKVKDWQAKLIEDDKLAAAKAAKKGKGGDKPKKEKEAKPAEAKKAPAPKAPAAAAKTAVAAPTAALTMTYPSKTDKEFQAKLSFYESVLEKSKYVYGNQLTSKDVAFHKVFEAKAGDINPATHPNVFGHFCFVGKLNQKMKDNLPDVEFAAETAKPAKKEEDDLDDLFGDDDDDGEAAKAAAAAAKEKSKKAKKPKAAAMSLVMLEVKPLDDTIDLDSLATKIFSSIT